MNKEVWKDIVDFPNYQVSNMGNIKNKNKNKMLKTQVNDKGYLYVSLYYKNKRKTCRINRLVAQAFIPNPNNLPEVNHKDENKQSNCVSNLEWCTHDYNVHYKTAIDRATQKKCKKICQYDLQGNFIRNFNSIKEASEYYHNTHIRDVLKKRRKTAAGYTWKYAFE